jgi:hypothetical protein
MGLAGGYYVAINLSLGFILMLMYELHIRLFWSLNQYSIFIEKIESYARFYRDMFEQEHYEFRVIGLKK